MTMPPETEHARMAKTQKTFYLHDDLAKIVDAVTASTGASLTKIVTAALIQYLLGDLGPPQSRWMQLAFGLERGDLTVIDVLARIAEHTIEVRQKEMQNARARVWNQAITDTYLAHCDEARGIMIGYSRALLEKLTKADDPLRALCSRWASMLDARPEGRVTETESASDE